MRKENKENGESSRHAKYKQCESSQSHPAQLPGPVQAEETENVNKKRRWNQINKDKVINGKHSSTQGSSKNPKRHRTIGIFEKKKKKRHGINGWYVVHATKERWKGASEYPHVTPELPVKSLIRSTSSES